MTGRTHDLAAFTALGAVALASIGASPGQLHSISMATLGWAVVSNLIGGIAPDIDEPTAPFWRNLPIGGVFGKIVHRLLGGHRFISHSLIGVGLFGFGWFVLLEFLHPSMPGVDIGIVWVAFMIGVLSHLVMDSFTEEGVPWLLPIPVKFGFPPIKRMRIVTGGWFEMLIVFPGLLLVNAWLYWSHYRTVLAFLHGYVR